MAAKRKITEYFDTKPQPLFPIFSMPPAKRRVTKNNAKKGQIEEIFARFPNLSEKIFGLLDYKTLANCNEVNRNWFETLNNQRIYWILMIKKFTSTCEKFRNEWMLAIDKSPFETLKKLAELSQNCSVKGYSSLLHIVAKSGNIDLFKFVVQKIGYKHTKDCYRDSTPLHLAARRGHFNICKFIIDQVDDKNPQNKFGFTPFHYATLWVDKKNQWPGWDQNYNPDAEYGHFEICQLIFDCIGHKNPIDNNGLTPFHLAAAIGNLKICQMIIEKVEVKNPEKNDGNTVLHTAGKKGNLEIFKLIFDKTEVKNPRNQIGITPLHHAAKDGHLEICKLICSSIKDKNPVDNLGETPLDLALLSSVKNKSKQEFARYENDLKVIHFLIGENNLQNR